MRRTGQVRAGAAVRAGWGLLLLAAPATVLRRVGGRTDDRALDVARLLGLRELLQASVTASAPTPAVVLTGTAVDTVHALTALGLALLDPRRHRPALANAATAAGWATLGAAAARRG